MINVLITGANGQLGSALKSIAKRYEGMLSLTFCTSAALNITDTDVLAERFKNKAYDYCINCAAYTNVDAAEENFAEANAINGLGVKNLALACKHNRTTLIHISTDFVFSGKQSHPYTEEDSTEPLGVYGQSKLRGEQEVINQLSNYYIIRTSWLYSEFGNNFMKSMLRLGRERDQLSVVNDQVGTPTYAVDLASFILELIKNNIGKYGIYHYSNEGVASWYDFAKAIFQEAHISVDLKPIPSSEYPLPAKRPSYSVMNKSKVKENFKINLPHWQDSLKVAIAQNIAYEKISG
jgi:dTDP-4-dehydrorhamnose reductase